MDKPNFKKLMRLSIQALTNFPYIEEDFDALTNYELLCKVVEELNKVSDNQKILDNNITLLIEAFNELKNYVDNYFENLDVQEEINNKLDDMAESGQLTDIIAQYLQLAGVLAYNTVADMKTATNLVDGSICKTLGFHTINDGGDSFYKVRTITNQDDVNEMDIIALNDNTLIAELIYFYPINPKKLGAYGDGIHDDLTYIQYTINKGNVKLSKGNYFLSNAINIGSNRIFDGNESTLIPDEDKYAIEIIGLPNSPVNQVNVRDLIINTTTNGGNGINIQYPYFVYIDNVNINRLSKNGAIGINQLGGFNTSITNSRVIGNRDYNGTYGIKITTDTGGTANMTNNKYDTLLIQNLTYGIYGKYDTTSNINEFNNIGFSNNDYSFYIDGYTDPIEFSNIRMEDTSDVTNSTGFYINGSVSSIINNLNAYNIKRVIDNNGSSDKKMLINGCVSLTGTTQSTKFLFIYHSSQNIYYNANDRIIGNTYNFDNSTSFETNVSLINNNSYFPAPNDLSTGSTTLSPNNKYIYKLTTTNLLNLYGRKNSQCKIYTTESNLKIVGSGSSQTHQGAEKTLIPNRIYNIYFVDLNKFIISD